jgi:hypothetical protein
MDLGVAKMLNSVAAIENLPPIDRLTVRLAEWARSMGHDVIDPLSVPGQGWVSPTRVKRPDRGDLPEQGNAEQERPQKSFLRDSYVQFVIDRVSKEVTIRIIDRQSGEVIRTVPPEEILKLLYDADTRTGSLVQTNL